MEVSTTAPILVIGRQTASAAVALVTTTRTTALRNPLNVTGEWPPVTGAAFDAHLSAIADEARRQVGSQITRLVLTVPALDDPRDELISRGEAAGFPEVELIDEAVAVALDPRLADELPAGGLTLVCDLAAEWTVACVHRRGDRSRLLARQHAAVDADHGALLTACHAAVEASAAVPGDVVATILTGPLEAPQGTEDVLMAAFGSLPRRAPDPKLAAVRGAAAWASGAAQRVVTATVPGWRTEPLAWDVPGGEAHLLHWSVQIEQPYPAGAVLAEIRTADDVLVRLTAPQAGCLPGPLPPAGTPIGPVLAVSTRRPAAALGADPPRLLHRRETAGSYLLSADRHVLLECDPTGSSVRSSAAATGELLGVLRTAGGTDDSAPAAGSGGRLFVDPAGRPVLVTWEPRSGVCLTDVQSGEPVRQLADAVGARRVLLDETAWRLAVISGTSSTADEVTVFDLHTGERLTRESHDEDWTQRHPGFRRRSHTDGLTGEAVSTDGRLHAVAHPAGVLLRDSVEDVELCRLAAPPRADALVAFDGDDMCLLINWESPEGSRFDVLRV